MMTFQKKSLFAVLLAGTAMVAAPAIAQEQVMPDAQEQVMPEKRPVQTEGQTGAAKQDRTADQHMRSADKAGANAMEKRHGETAGTNNAAEAKPADRPAGAADDAQAGTSGSMKSQGQASDRPADRRATTNQAASDRVSNETTGSIDVTNEQQREIRQVFVDNRAEPVDVDFDVSLGAAVPTTVTLQPLPPRIVEIVPAYQGYEYFVLADGRIVIVEPATHQVVYIVTS